jgi:hypothetical protein
MNEDMPWVNLTQEEVEELRNKKHELTEYGKQRLRELIYKQDMKKMEDAAKNLVLENLTLGTKALENGCPLLYNMRNHKGTTMDCEPYDADKFADEERRERSNTVLRRYNHFYNEECSGLPHGTPITPEHMQAITLECMVDALICENMNVEYNVIAIDDIKDLIARLYQQSDEFLARVRKNNE